MVWYVNTSFFKLSRQENKGKGGVMFGLGAMELVIILVIVLIIFGAGRLPEIGAGIGKGIQNFKKATREETPEADKIEDNSKKA